VASTWTYSDYVTLTGSAKRDRLALHVQEVSDSLAGGSYSVEGLSVSRPNDAYLAHIKVELRELDAQLGGNRVMWASGRAVL
jgi:hypothetical protein